MHITEASRQNHTTDIGPGFFFLPRKNIAKNCVRKSTRADEHKKYALCCACYAKFREIVVYTLRGLSPLVRRRRRRHADAAITIMIRVRRMHARNRLTELMDYKRRTCMHGAHIPIRIYLCQALYLYELSDKSSEYFLSLRIPHFTLPLSAIVLLSLG